VGEGQLRPLFRPLPLPAALAAGRVVVDTDVVCWRPFEFSESYVVATYWERRGTSMASNCVLKLPAGNPVARYCLDTCEQMEMETVEYGATGPTLVNRALDDLGFRHIAVPWTTFCPIGYRDATELTRRPGAPSLRGLKRLLRRQPPVRVGAESYAVHLWNEMWRQNNMDKEATYHPRCYHEQLKARYGAGISA
jgi:hypothetical protein